VKPEHGPPCTLGVVIIFLALASLAAIAFCFLARPSEKVIVTYKGIDRIYADGEFKDVALFSFTNRSRLIVDRYIGTVRTRSQAAFGKHIPTYTHDEAATNQLMFRSTHAVQLKPGTGEILALPVIRGTNEWRVEFLYSYEGLRYKLAMWFGPAKGGALVPGWLRVFPVSSFESTWLQPLPEEPGAIRAHAELKPLHTGVRSFVQYRSRTNSVPIKSKP
jgi:hypothetical protein